MTRRRRRYRVFGLWAAGAIAGLVVALAAWMLGAPLVAGLAAATTVAGLVLADRHMRRRGAVPVIVYHSVSPDPGWLPWADNISVRPAVFARHMAALVSRGWTVLATRDLVAARKAGTALPVRAVAIHFDDGYRDNLLFAVPVLREHGLPASIFVASDFIAPSAPNADGPEGARGYLTASELRDIDRDPLFEIGCHGRDHGRLAVSDRAVDRLTADNWRLHAALIWAATPGNKALWFQADGPAPLQLGAPVPESDSSLCARAWRDGARETEAERDDRVLADLATARREVSEALGHEVDTLCWPFDRCTEASRASAHAAGFTTVTGGTGMNRPDEPAHVLSRVHINDRAAGGGPVWLEGLWFHAKLSVAADNLYWLPVAAFAAVLRRIRMGGFRHGPAAPGAMS